MPDLTAGFETGVDGNDVLTTDTGDATAWDFRSVGGGGAITYDNDHVAFGALAAKVVSTGAACYVGWTSTYTDHYGRMYLYLTANPAASFPILQAQDAVGRVARVDVFNTGRIRIIDSPATGDQLGTVAIATNQLVRLEWHFVHSATVGQIEVKLFNTASSTSPDETITSPASWNTGASSLYQLFGNPAAGGSFTYWLDNIVAGATSYPGPTAVPARIRTPKRLVGPTLVTNSPVTGYTVPANYVTRMRHVHISNPSGSPVDMTLSIGTDAAATRLLDGKPIAADSVYEMACDEALTAGEIVQMFASSTNVLTITISGEEWVPA